MSDNFRSQPLSPGHIASQYQPVSPVSDDAQYSPESGSDTPPVKREAGGIGKNASTVQHVPSLEGPSSRRPGRRRARGSRFHFGEWWVLEIGGVLLSIGCLVAIFGICARVQRRPLEDWKSSISPNAMVSTLSTLSKAGALFAVAEAVGQLKWLHFLQRPRRLANVETFNRASANPLGALYFLFNMNIKSWVGSFASITIIAALAFEPMAQQVFTYTTGPIPLLDAVSRIPVAQVYDTGVFWDIAGDHDLIDGMTKALDNALKAADALIRAPIE